MIAFNHSGNYNNSARLQFKNIMSRLFLENLVSIFNLEQDGIVLLIQLRDDLFNLFVQIFYCGKRPYNQSLLNPKKAMKKTLKLNFQR